jgi:hypothetical protein
MDTLKHQSHVTTLHATGTWHAIAVSLITLLLYSGAGFAQQASDQYISITQHQGYQHLLSSLKSFIQNTKTQQTRHHFFIAKYPPNREYTYIFWLEGKAVWNVNLTGITKEHWQSTIETPSSGAFVNLDTDVVDEIGTSTYLVSTSWAKQVIYDSILNGDRLVIDKNSTHIGE